MDIIYVNNYTNHIDNNTCTPLNTIHEINTCTLNTIHEMDENKENNEMDENKEIKKLSDRVHIAPINIPENMIANQTNNFIKETSFIHNRRKSFYSNEMIQTYAIHKKTTPNKNWKYLNDVIKFMSVLHERKTVNHLQRSLEGKDNITLILEKYKFIINPNKKKRILLDTIVLVMIIQTLLSKPFLIALLNRDIL